MPSYLADNAKARAAHFLRVAWVVPPLLAAISSRRSPYWSGSVTMVVETWFLAVERIMEGPPMSMFSTHCSKVTFSRFMVSSKGYRLRMVMSMLDMPWALMSASCAAFPRTASNPPWIFGCRVLTRPSRHSAPPVNSETSVTARPASRSFLAVPPVLSSSVPWVSWRALQKPTIPVLSETLTRARFIGTTSVTVPSTAESTWAMMMMMMYVCMYVCIRSVSCSFRLYGWVGTVFLRGMIDATND
mmetsp:Transcript_17178/g.39212  ORF Transcript_17178/g.39212 Transcript_17178/m.39212 type:complete len:244 (-) Transcript_17178:94-825(-)